MPLGPGGLDSNGIWLYGEDDSEALASDLLNLGMQSVSDALIGGLGAILQVVSTSKTDTFSASVAPGGLASVTGLTASITPSSTSSKVLVFVAVDGSATVAHGHVAFRLMRGASPIGVGDTAGSRTSLTASQTPAYASDSTAIANGMKQFLDSPSTTSSTTYSVEIHNATSSSQTLYVNRSSADINDAPRARTISTITLIEVAG